MRLPAAPAPAWLTFRRAFLWTLAALALLWSLRADAADLQGPVLCDTPETITVQPIDALPPMPVPVAEPAPAAAVIAAPPMPNPPSVPFAPADAPTPAADPTAGLQGASVTQFPQDNWTVTILPNPVSHSDELRRKYEQVYASIPYSKAEYLANPGYRHETAVEVMFGQMRPKTVVSQYQPRTIPAPFFTNYKPYMNSRVDMYSRFYPASFANFGFGMPLTPYYPNYPRYPTYW